MGDLARIWGVHPNTVRLHLARLVDAGLLVEAVERDGHPGRPGCRYHAAGGDPASEAAEA